MAKSPTALVDPSLLRWARESARLGVGDAASRLKVDETRLQAWEDGEQSLTISQLRKLAAAYRRPVAVFFLPEPPKDFEALRDFRRLKGDKPAELSDSLQAELQRTQRLREAALDLSDSEEEASPLFELRATIRDDVDTVAAAIRTRLGVTHDEQRSWGGPYAALREWRQAVEGLGALVVNMSKIDIEDARGFSIAEFPLPLIALNAKDTANGRVFTLMHELVHLVLHESGICDWTKEQKLEPESRAIESFCNRVAASILLPESLVYEVVSSVAQHAADHWPDDVLRRHARELCVSEEALLRRFVTLGLATQDFYAAKRLEYIERYAQAATKTSKPIVTYEKRIVGALGTAYLDLAFSAYYARRLSLSELSSYTGVRVSNLRKVEREAFGISRVPGDS
jgi:Zn-dependent peptidase ImmA (M78 family)